MRGTILHKLVYLLATTMFTTKQCVDIMQPVLQDRLPKVGIICAAPKSLIHGPLPYSRFNIPNLYSEQFISQLMMLYPIWIVFQ